MTLEPVLATLAFIMGASVGSFLNLAADRVPARRSIVQPRSFCESCGRSLDSLDLVPVLSYLWLRGKCRYCGVRIPVRMMVVEALTGALFLILYFQYGFEIEFAVLGAAISLLIVVALIDLDHRLILDRITFPTMAVLIILSPFWTELDLTRSFMGNESMVASALNSLLTGLGSFLIFMAIALVFPNGMGGGDVKLAGVIGLMAGFPDALIALWLAALSGGVVAIGLLAFRKLGRKDQIPYGPFLAIGATVALLAGSEITSLYLDLGDFMASSRKGLIAAWLVVVLGGLGAIGMLARRRVGKGGS